MNVMKIITLFFVTVALCNCQLDVKMRRTEKLKAFAECTKEIGLKFSIEMESKLRKENNGTRYKPETLPKEYLCRKKCTAEKIGTLKDGKIQIDEIKTEMEIVAYKTPEDYLKCLKAIDVVKDCEDYRKIMECEYTVGDTYLRECTDNEKTDLGSYRRRNYCIRKCEFEATGILDKNGKIVTEKAEKDIRLMWKVKDKSNFLSCLKDLEIKKCNDMKKIWSCKSDQ